MHAITILLLTKQSLNKNCKFGFTLYRNTVKINTSIIPTFATIIRHFALNEICSGEEKLKRSLTKYTQLHQFSIMKIPDRSHTLYSYCLFVITLQLYFNWSFKIAQKCFTTAINKFRLFVLHQGNVEKFIFAYTWSH